jgi:hypothetical protein
LPLLGLPPKAKEIDSYPATLSIQATELSADAVPDPDSFSAMDIAEEMEEDEGEIEYDCEDEVEFDLNPDQRPRLVTAGSDPERLVIRQHED